MLNETIKTINELNERKKQLEKELNEVETELEPLRQTALDEIKEAGLKEYHNDGLVIFLSTRTTKGYSKEEEKQILDILKQNNLSGCISIKESLSKKDLNKELKTNDTLKTLLENFGKETSTEYVQVMTEESAEKRQQAIEENKK